MLSYTLIQGEIDACRCVDMTLNNNIAVDTEDNNDIKEEDVLEQIPKQPEKRGRQHHQLECGGYRNVNFIYGSTAEVERLGSVAKHILTDTRKDRMDYDLFEAILYLKTNSWFWGFIKIVQADVERANSVLSGNTSDEDMDETDEVAVEMV